MKNKPASIDGLIKDVTKITSEGMLEYHTASSFRGKVIYADSHTIGRCARFGMKQLNEKADGKSKRSSVSVELSRDLS